MMAEEENPWTILATERRFENPFFAVDEHRVFDPAGQESSYGVVRFRNVGLRIVPIAEDGTTFLVGQYRFGAAYFSWELPSGGQEPGEDARTGAERELREEVGLMAECWQPLFEVVPSGSITDQRERSFVAWQLRPAERDLDTQEVIRVRRVPFNRAVRMALDGEIGDAGTILALVALDLKARRGELPEGLGRLLNSPPA
jgi:8-oxo-dGTP pyrophosphatase MutT (NUDIX family)